jgi:hypothetical protein
MKLNSGTLIAGAVLLLTLMLAGLIALRGDTKPVTTAGEQSIPINVSGTMPERGRASEASVVPQPDKPLPADPVPPLPPNWR